MVRTAALTYGAQGGLAARSFAINEMLRRYQAQLDSAYDFRALVLPVGTGQTLMRPPIVSAAQMAFALGDSGQVARETSCIYQITREAQLASAPPNWRTYLVRIWVQSAPADRWRAAAHQAGGRLLEQVGGRRLGAGREAGRRDLPLRSRSAASATSSAWRATACCCAPGWSNSPSVAFQNQAVDGGRDSLHVGDQTIRITDQPGLQGNPRRWSAERGLPAVSRSIALDIGSRAGQAAQLANA